MIHVRSSRICDETHFCLNMNTPPPRKNQTVFVVIKRYLFIFTYLYITWHDCYKGPICRPSKRPRNNVFLLKLVDDCNSSSLLISYCGYLFVILLHNTSYDIINECRWNTCKLWYLFAYISNMEDSMLLICSNKTWPHSGFLWKITEFNGDCT